MGADFTEFDQPLLAGLQRWGLELDPNRLDRLRTHLTAMLEANRRFNLTRITGFREAAVRHYVDSLSLIAWACERKVEPQRVLDIGTGAGFPAIPLAIMRPDWSVTAIDGTRKKSTFVARMAADLNLENLTVEHAHSAHWQPPSLFDLVTFRAAGKLAPMLREARRLATPGAWIIAFTNETLPDKEQADVARAMSQLGLEWTERYAYSLSLDDQPLHRALFVTKVNQPIGL